MIWRLAVRTIKRTEKPLLIYLFLSLCAGGNLPQSFWFRVFEKKQKTGEESITNSFSPVGLD